MTIRELSTAKSAACAEILAALPEWFGIPEANATYIRNVESLPAFAAEVENTLAGFLALKQHTPHAAEIYLLGVKPQFHRRGVGRALVACAESHLRARGVRFFTVKTLSPSVADSNYAATRQFYGAMGFLPIEEFPTLWSAKNPALMLAKLLD